MRVLIFGDSITQGFWDGEGGWVSRIRKHFDKLIIAGTLADIPTVYNLGVSGDKTKDIIERIEHETKAREWPNEPFVIMLAVGINDSILIENKAELDIYEFQEQYEKLVDISKKLAGRVICVGLTAVDESLTDPFADSESGKQLKNNRINLFQDTIKQVASQKEVDFIPVHDMFLKMLEKGVNSLQDGLHPNDEGHEMLEKIILPKLLEYLV